jgi:hypothetical protein
MTRTSIREYAAILRPRHQAVPLLPCLPTGLPSCGFSVSRPTRASCSVPTSDFEQPQHAHPGLRVLSAPRFLLPG